METNIKHIIKMVIASRNHTQSAVAKKAGWKNQSSLATAIGRDNPSLDTLIRICDALEYDIVIQDRNSANKYVITKEAE